MASRKLINTELEYVKCFSNLKQLHNSIRFKDDNLKNMYMHNFTYIKNPIFKDEFSELIKEEIKESKKDGKDFLNIQFDFDINELKDFIEEKKCELTIYDYFQVQIEQLDKLLVRQDCFIKKLNREQFDKALEFDVRINGEELGSSFVKRRFERRSEVYLENGLVDNYLCYFNGEIVGHCDLFLNDDVAKIEDFDVAPEFQRKGFGTRILKEIVKIARKKGAKSIYLITDDDDTAKEMYQKCGMVKVGEKIEVLYEF